MRGALVCGPLALLFLASVLPTNAQKAASGEAVVWVAEGAPLLVECPLRVEQRVEWRLDGGPLPEGVRASEAAAARGEAMTARLRAEAAGPRHKGVYSCARGPEAARVRVALLPAPGSESASASPSATVAPSSDAAAVLYYDVRAPISLDCGGLSDDPAANIVWTKNDTLLENIPELKERYKLTASGGVERAVFSSVGKTREDDFGNYSCSVSGRIRAWQVRGRTHAKLPPDTSVVEGQKLKLTCKLTGKPYPPVAWSYSNDTSEGNATGVDVRVALGSRVSLQPSEQGVAEAELVLEPAARADAGRITCSPQGEGLSSSTTLRVKDMYAALWPFLGICAEVFVLCAVILVYEKRRTKPELDDSDTDNHDQKKS